MVPLAKCGSLLYIPRSEPSPARCKCTWACCTIRSKLCSGQISLQYTLSKLILPELTRFRNCLSSGKSGSNETFMNNALPINKFMRISICSGLCVDSKNMKLPSNHGIPWQDISKAFMRGLRFPRGEVARAQTLHFCVSRRSMAEIDRTKESMFFINLTSGASFLPPPFPLRLRLCMFDILTKFALYKLNKMIRTALSLRSPHFWESRKWMSSGIASKFRLGITLFLFLYYR